MNKFKEKYEFLRKVYINYGDLENVEDLNITQLIKQLGDKYRASMSELKAIKLLDEVNSYFSERAVSRADGYQEIKGRLQKGDVHIPRKWFGVDMGDKDETKWQYTPKNKRFSSEEEWKSQYQQEPIVEDDDPKVDGITAEIWKNTGRGDYFSSSEYAVRKQGKTAKLVEEMTKRMYDKLITEKVFNLMVSGKNFIVKLENGEIKIEEVGND